MVNVNSPHFLKNEKNVSLATLRTFFNLLKLGSNGVTAKPYCFLVSFKS